MNCNCGICGLRCLPMPSSPCFATTAATAVAAAAALSDTTGNFQLLEVLFLIYFMYFHVIPWRSSGRPIPWSKSPFSILLVVICQSTGTLTLFQLAHFVPIPGQVLPATGQRRLAVALEALFDLGRIDNHLKDLWNHQVAENPCLLEMPVEWDLDQAPMTLIYRFLIVYL